MTCNRRYNHNDDDAVANGYVGSSTTGVESSSSSSSFGQGSSLLWTHTLRPYIAGPLR